MLINFIGQCIINLFSTLKYIFSGNFSLKNTLMQSAYIGYDSIPIALIISFVSGSVLALQVSKQFVMSGAEAYIGGLISLAIVREMSPIAASLAIGARAGTAIAAEIANMQVTEQIDAIKTLKINPVGYLFAPRIIAGIIVVPLVTILSELIGVLGGMFISNISVNLHINRYITSVWNYLEISDINISILKGAVFGLLITLICCTQGYLTRGGAKEVGVSTTKAAIWSSIAVLIFDYLLTWIYYS